MKLKILAAIISFSLLFIHVNSPIALVQAAAQDNNVWWDGVYFNSRDTYYKSPVGFVFRRTDNIKGDMVFVNENIRFRIRVFENDVTAVKLRIWKSYAAVEVIYDMTKVASDGTYEWWEVTVPAPNTVENYWYHFRVIDGTDEDYYSDDSKRDAGIGQMYDLESDAINNDYLLLYRPIPTDPQSMVVYQIVVDRFFDGDNSNNDPAKSQGVYDPRGENGNWKYYWGGDLLGIQQKLDYIQGMGVTAIWISPVVDAVDRVLWPENENETSYHGYFARDFKQIDEHLGTWGTFENFVIVAKNKNIRIIVDFAPNHTNPANSGDNAALYDNGVFVTDNVSDYNSRYFNEYTRSWENIYHHNGAAANRNDRWETRYKNIWEPLPDFNQLNPWVDNYLKESIKLLLNSGVGGIRIDMSKHMDQAWLGTLSDYVYAGWENIYITHEWYNGFDDDLYWDLCQFDNNYGMHMLNIPLNWTIRDVWGYKTKTMSDLEAKVNKQFGYPVSDIMWNQKIGNFVSSHDTPRFLSINLDEDYLHQALAFTLTIPGIPIIYYGEEQYLHNDNLGNGNVQGGDPYNREWMKYWDTNTVAYKVIRKLSDLRKASPALRYGLITTRYVSENVYVYQRKFFDDVVLIAINKDKVNDVVLTNVLTDLPNDNYSDYLENLLRNGQKIEVISGNIPSMLLPKDSVGVWYIIREPTGPWLGAIDPVMGRPGNKVQINGKGFGSTAGTVKFYDGTNIINATILSWSDVHIFLQVPSGLTPALNKKHVEVYVQTANGENSNRILFQYLTKRQVLVVHEVENTAGTSLETTLGQYLFITGGVPEYSNWSNRSENALGPMLCPDWDDWFFVVMAPYSTTIEFKHIKAALGGAGTWEIGSNHSYTSPESGILYVRVAANR